LRTLIPTLCMVKLALCAHKCALRYKRECSNMVARRKELQRPVFSMSLLAEELRIRVLKLGTALLSIFSRERKAALLRSSGYGRIQYGTRASSSCRYTNPSPPLILSSLSMLLVVPSPVDTPKDLDIFERLLLTIRIVPPR
jgi:hypothetical protein